MDREYKFYMHCTSVNKKKTQKLFLLLVFLKNVLGNPK